MWRGSVILASWYVSINVHQMAWRHCVPWYNHEGISERILNSPSKFNELVMWVQFSYGWDYYLNIYLTNITWKEARKMMKLEKIKYMIQLRLNIQEFRKWRIFSECNMNGAVMKKVRIAKWTWRKTLRKFYKSTRSILRVTSRFRKHMVLLLRIQVKVSQKKLRIWINVGHSWDG